MADPPPSLDEMTQVINEIPVTGQKINPGRGASDEDRVEHYYVSVTENLSSLSIETYGGNGNVNLAISAITVRTHSIHSLVGKNHGLVILMISVLLENLLILTPIQIGRLARAMKNKYRYMM